MADIETLLKEKRVFKPSSGFAKRANWSRKTTNEYRKLGARSPERFWAKMAREHVTWFTPWKQVLRWKPPFARWFVGGKLNVSYNCLDRHLEGEHSWRRNKAAIIWEGEPGDSRVLTFSELHREVCKFANVLKGLGVKKGDRVALYMPMIPELAVAMLACTRIGAPHSIVFGGFSAEALRDRINDAGAHAVVTADGGFRRGPCRERPGSRAWSWSGAPASPSPCRADATTGGTTSWPRPPPAAPRRSWTRSIRCSSSTPAAPPESPRASSTPPADT
jgi:acetyl-CoA synthetase